MSNILGEARKEELSSGAEYIDAVVLANKLLDEPYADPDDDLRMLSRQFLRQIERTNRVRTEAIQEAIGVAKTCLPNAFETMRFDSVSEVETWTRMTIAKALEQLISKE